MMQKTTIFSRLLLASAVPFAVVFGLAMLVAGTVTFDFHEKRVKDEVAYFARYAGEKINDHLLYNASLLKLTSQHLADTAEDTPEARRRLERIVRSCMASNLEIARAWYVFRHGVVCSSPSLHARFFARTEHGIGEIPAVTEEILNNPAAAPWHVRPFSTGVAYFNTLDRWEPAQGRDNEYAATIAHPIIDDGVIVGTVGVDILYREAFRFMRRWQVVGGREVMLISGSGDVISSCSPEYTGKNLRDFGFHPEDLGTIVDALAARRPFMGEIDSPVCGERALIHLATVSLQDAKPGLFLYVDAPVAQLYGEIGRVNQFMFFVFLLGVGVLLGTVVFTTNTIVRPLAMISRIARGIAEGTEAVHPEQLDFEGWGGREVTVLSESLKKMIERLNENHHLKIRAITADFDRKKTEEASRARTQFFANMSHELRTPMNAIVGISDILLAEKLPPRQESFVRDIKISSEALLVIIDDILDISRMEAGKLKLVNSHFDLHRMLDNVASMALFLAKKKALSFALERPDDVPQFVYGDEVRIRQILLNLLGNAVKFTERGGVTLRAGTETDCLTFSVIDTGIGIKAEDRPALFNAFRQVDTVRNREIKGAGLGLSITHNLVVLMGGQIDLQSEYGIGSTFTVRLPLAQGDEQKVDRGTRIIEGAIDHSAAVLVVDDNAVNLKVAVGVLGLFGLKPDTASSGREAIEKITDREYRLVFMDHMMPDMDGAETIRRLRAMGGRFAEVPIVAFTANTLDGAREMVREAGMNDFLAKPIRKDALKTVLLRWLPAIPDGLAVLSLDNTEPNDIITSAGAIPGLNPTEGLSRCGGDIGRYLEALRKIRENLPGEVARFKRNGIDAFPDAVHAIGSALREVGATELVTLGEALVAAKLDIQVDDFAVGCDEFEKRLKEFVEALRRLPL